MKYQSEALREMLAAEYVLGTLHGGARARFERLLKFDAVLRRTVRAWQALLYPLTVALTEIEPPTRVWRAIQTRIENQRTHAKPVSKRTGLWRGLALASCAALLLLIAYIGFFAQPELQPVSFALLSDDKAKPVMLTSLQRGRPGAVRVKLLTQPAVEAGNALELWVLPAGPGAPVSLGVVSDAVSQTLVLLPAAQRALQDAKGIAVSVEPAGGSPTGAPTGPVILQGIWLTL